MRIHSNIFSSECDLFELPEQFFYHLNEELALLNRILASPFSSDLSLNTAAPAATSYPTTSTYTPTTITITTTPSDAFHKLLNVLDTCLILSTSSVYLDSIVNTCLVNQLLESSCTILRTVTFRFIHSSNMTSFDLLQIKLNSIRFVY